MPVNFWPYWIAFGGSALVGAGLTLLSYSKKEPVRQWRWAMMALMCLVHTVAYGFLALGQSYLLRDDGIKILFGRWWLYAVTHGLVAAVVILGFTQFLLNHLVVWVLATVSSLALVGISYTPTDGGSDSPAALWYWFAISCVAAIATAVYGVIVAMDLQRFFFFPAEDKENEGRAMMQNRFWHALAIGATGFLLCLYALLSALGPEGWDVYSGSRNARENLQIWLTLVLDFIKFLVLVLAYIFLDPSGDVQVMQPFGVVPMRSDASDYSAAPSSGSYVALSTKPGGVAL